MRILFLTSWLPNSYNLRAGIFNRSRLTALAGSGAEIDVVFFNTLAQPIRYFLPFPRLSKIVRTYKAKRNLEIQVDISNVNIFRVNTFHLPNKYAWPRWEQIYYWSCRRTMKDLFKKNHYDLIIASRVVPEGAVLSYFTHDVHCPIAVIAEGGEVLEDAFECKGWKKSAAKIDKANFHVVCVSKEMEKVVRDAGLFKNVTTISNGYGSKLFALSGSKGPNNKKSGITKLVAVGRISPVKGYDILIRSLSRSSRRFVLTIVGDGDDNLKKKLIDLVRHYSIEDRVIFLGDIPHEKIPEILLANDIFCMPSRSESFGTAALEAMGCGLPVVAAGVGGLKDLVIDGFNGFTFEKEDVNGLTEKLERAEEADWDPEKISDWAKKNYSWDYWSTRILEFAGK